LKFNKNKVRRTNRDWSS